MVIKKILGCLLLLTGVALGQAARYDSISQGLTANNLYTVTPNATVKVYIYPGATTNCATAGTCTLATTYTDQTEVSGCGTSSPLTRPATNSCVGVVDSGGNFGFWVAPGSYQYCITAAGFGTSCTNITLSTAGLRVDGTTFPQTIAGIQTAVNLLSSGGKVSVASGTFPGTTTLSIPANVTLQCDSQSSVLQFTGSATPLSFATNAVLRDCKIDASGNTAALLLTTTGDSGLLEHNWILGNANHAESQSKVNIANNNWTSAKNKYDTISFVHFIGTDGFQADSDTFVNYRTGYWCDNSTDFAIENPRFLSTADVLTNGFDSTLISGCQYGILADFVVKASDEHGIYFSGLASGSTPNTDVQVVGGVFNIVGGSAVKVHASSTAVNQQERGISIIGIIVNGVGAAQNDAIQADEVVGLTVSGGTILNQNYGVDIQGLADHVQIGGNLYIQASQASGVRVQDTNGAVTHLTIQNVKILNSSLSGAGNFSGIEIQPTAGFVNTDITIDTIEADDNQGSPTQNYAIQLDTPAGGSTVSRLRITNPKGQGNLNGVISDTPGGYTNFLYMLDPGLDYPLLSGLGFNESGGANTALGRDICYGNSGHFLRCSVNNGNFHRWLLGENGSCSMAAGTTCTFSIAGSFTTVLATYVSLDAASTPPGTANAAKCAVSSTTVTITAANSNSLTWDCLLIGY